MTIRYRVRLFEGTDGTMATGVCPHKHLTGKTAEACAVRYQARNVGVEIQIRLFPGEPWRYLDRMREIARRIEARL